MIWDLQASYNIGVQLVSLNPPALSLKLVKGRREPKLLPLRMTDCPGARTNKEGRWKEWTDAYLAQFFKLPTPFGVFLLSSFFQAFDGKLLYCRPSQRRHSERENRTRNPLGRI